MTTVTYTTPPESKMLCEHKDGVWLTLDKDVTADGKAMKAGDKFYICIPADKSLLCTVSDGKDTWHMSMYITATG